MKNHYTNLLSETHKEIWDIRHDSLNRITEAQNVALIKIKEDFATLGWNKFWLLRQLLAEGQFEQFEQSVLDPDLKLVQVDEINKTGVVEDRVASCEVSGQKCSCADFTFRGLPCKHLYFLAGVLVDLLDKQTEGENLKGSR